MRKVAITGGLASGKSTVCHFLKDFGAYTLSADDIVHELLSSPHTATGQQVIELLGTNILTEGALDRQKIAKLVFSHPEQLQRLEQLLHPLVLKEIKEHYNKVKNQNYPLFVAEIPLLYESKSEAFFDFVITVIADETNCIKRFQKTKNLGCEEYQRRMLRQIPSKEKAEKSDYIIINNTTLTELKENTYNLFQKLTGV